MQYIFKCPKIDLWATVTDAKFSDHVSSSLWSNVSKVSGIALWSVLEIYLYLPLSLSLSSHRSLECIGHCHCLFVGWFCISRHPLPAFEWFRQIQFSRSDSNRRRLRLGSLEPKPDSVMERPPHSFNFPPPLKQFSATTLLYFFFNISSYFARRSK